jgi:acetyl esterase/lipase
VDSVARLQNDDFHEQEQNAASRLPAPVAREPAHGFREKTRGPNEARINSRMLAVILAVIALALSIWIVVPGPVPALFVLTVAGTELWPILTLVDAIVVVVAWRSDGGTRLPAIAMSVASLACTLVPLAAYLAGGPRVPLRAFLSTSAPRGAAASSSDAPLVLAIYGGAWQRGSPQNDARLNAIITSWGFRVIGLDYPHAPESQWPAQIDAILQQIDAVHGGKVALIGHSSGAQLAIIAAALRPDRVSGVVTYESPVDLKLGYEYPLQPDIIDAKRILVDLCGGTPEQKPECYRDASPRYAVHAGMPPVLMIAAGRDHVIDIRLERLLRDELLGHGVAVTYVELPWADHAFETVADGFHNRIALWYVRRFLTDHGRVTLP